MVTAVSTSNKNASQSASKTGDSFFEPAGHTILKFDNARQASSAEIVCFYLADTKERLPIEMLGRYGCQLSKK